MKWDEQNDQYNCAAVFKLTLDGFWAFEIDGTKLVDQYKARPERNCLKPSSCVRVKVAVICISSTPQHRLPSGTSARRESDGFSVRADNEYCSRPLSIHPEHRRAISNIHDRPIIEAPDELVAWLASSQESCCERAKGRGLAQSTDSCRAGVTTDSRRSAVTIAVSEKTSTQFSQF